MVHQNNETVDEILARNRKRFVSQTTHFICACCGGDTPITNRELLPIKTEIINDKIARLYFPCPKCDTEYDLGLSITH